ncbi:MAG: hypothetical protein CBC16_06400, partial [Verrucomicrobia bacterium TMED56]
MGRKLFFSLFSFAGASLLAEIISWPQWRGPDRNGQGIVNFELIQDISEQEPVQIWESIEIPSQDDGGFGSVISDGQRAFLSVVWHRNEPTEERILDSVVMRKLGLRKVNLPPALSAKAERDRLSLSPRLRGSKLDKWIDDWIESNLDQKQKMTQGSLIASRFKQGKLAIPISVIDRMFSIKDRVFPSDKALEEWLNQQNFSPGIISKFSEGIPPTKRMADDVIIAF